MNEHFKSIIKSSTGATEIFEIEEIQSLWSGYGSIVRYGLKGTDRKSVVVKHVKLPQPDFHPRGWNTDNSHNRKIKSYQVETAWYQQYAECCTSDCKVPECFALESHGDEVLMVMEDLDDSGFSVRKSSVTWDDMLHCLKWLANFHAIFMNKTPKELWKIGTYWHLETRPDELEVMDDKVLKNAARNIDSKLNSAQYLTFVHGDAKLANFCFADHGDDVAAVDFQYVGGGCGMKDVIYFIGSCLYEEDCEKYEQQLLSNYFNFLKEAIQKHQKEINFDELEKEWRALFPIAWTDFHRFLKGWSPEHWKINSYSECMAREVIKNL